jgi:hypothetical protein
MKANFTALFLFTVMFNIQDYTKFNYHVNKESRVTIGAVLKEQYQVMKYVCNMYNSKSVSERLAILFMGNIRLFYNKIFLFGHVHGVRPPMVPM